MINDTESDFFHIGKGARVMVIPLTPALLFNLVVDIFSRILMIGCNAKPLC